MLPDRRYDSKDAWLLAALVLVLIGFKAWLTQAAGFDLHYDEAQYWEWSQQLDWSYYSKGPLVAWLIALSEALFGHGEWQTRLFGWLAHGVLLALVFAFARDVWGSRAAAWWAVLLALFTPLYFTLGLVMTTDVFLFVCWTWGLWAAYRALFKDRPRAWYGLGAAVGIGALTKLSIGLLPFFIGLMVLLRPQFWRHLKSPHLWLALLLMLVLMSPVLLWNASHDWVMFRHEMGHVKNEEWSAKYIADFIGGQALALSPIVVLLALGTLWRPPVAEDQRFLWWLSLCWIGFFIVKALSAKVQLNWSAPSYIGLLILFAGHIPAFSRVKRRVLYFGMGVGAALTAVAYFPSTFGVPEPFKNTKLWRQPIEKIGIQAGDADFILTSSYDLAAELAYYWPQRIPVYVAGNAGRRYNQHDLWPSIDREAGRNGVYINTNPSLPTELARAFERCSSLPPSRRARRMGGCCARFTLAHAAAIVRLSGRNLRPIERSSNFWDYPVKVVGHGGAEFTEKEKLVTVVFRVVAVVYRVRGMAMIKSTLAMTLFLTVSVNAMADFNAGVAAYEAKDYKLAFKEFSAVALEGDVRAQGLIAGMYASGLGVVKDGRQAVRWYHKAAEGGDAHSQFVLGVMYANGRGVSKDDLQALRWYQKAAGQGLADAQYNLGVIYARGRAVPQDEAEAVKWYLKAAEQGIAEAQYNLGSRYAEGRGVPKDDAEAVYWYQNAAEQGLAAAQNNLGSMYASGRGVPKDDAQAVQWYLKAAEQGVAAAQINLGNMYADGRGVPKDQTQALNWYRKAAE